MKHLKRFESASKTIRHREYRQLYKDYFSDMLSSRTGFNNTGLHNHYLPDILGEIVGDAYLKHRQLQFHPLIATAYDDVVYDVDYLEKVKQDFQNTKEDFDNLSNILKDLEEEYGIESVIYTIKPYGKYKQEISHGRESLPAFRTNPTKIKTSLDTEDAVFDVYIGLSNEIEGTGLYEMIQSDTMKGVTDFIRILESKGSKVEMILFTGSVRKNSDEMRYRSFINLKFNYKY